MDLLIILYQSSLGWLLSVRRCSFSPTHMIHGTRVKLNIIWTGPKTLTQNRTFLLATTALMIHNEPERYMISRDRRKKWLLIIIQSVTMHNVWHMLSSNAPDMAPITYRINYMWCAHVRAALQRSFHLFARHCGALFIIIYSHSLFLYCHYLAWAKRERPIFALCCGIFDEFTMLLWCDDSP